MKILPISLLAILLSTAPLCLAQYEELAFQKGVMDYQSMRFKKAEKRWKAAANRGHALSMYSLARLYHYGDLGKRDLEAAKHWYEAAAQSGVAPAMYLLGTLLVDDKEYAEAAKWLTKAAQEDNADAQNELAILYEEGNGVEQSIDTAAEWYLKAAENGSAPAKFKMVLLYSEGNGVEQNNAKAFEWATKAAESGDANAKYLLGYMYYSGTGTVQSLEMAAIWLEEAVDDGQDKAKTLLEKVHSQMDMSAI